MSAEERALVIATLPSEFPASEASPQGDAPVRYADELIDRVSRLSAEAHGRAQRLETELAEEQRLREEQQRLREEEQRLRAAAEAALEELRAELERLRGRKD